LATARRGGMVSGELVELAGVEPAEDPVGKACLPTTAAPLCRAAARGRPPA
jgi:hypothetical protein